MARDVDDAIATLKYAAKIMPLWPAHDKEELRDAQLNLIRHAKAKRGPDSRHRWMAQCERWCSEKCYALASTRERCSGRGGEVCPGHPRHTVEVLTSAVGHTVATADVDGGPCLLCVACGAYATTKPKDLLHRCKGMAGRGLACAYALK